MKHKNAKKIDNEFVFSLSESLKWAIGYLYGNLTGVFYNLIYIGNSGYYWLGIESFVKGFETGFEPYI